MKCQQNLGLSIAPLGLWLFDDRRVLYTCRPSGALGHLVCPFSINMSPLWGFKTFGLSVFYKHVAPLGLNTPLPRLLVSSLRIILFKTTHTSTTGTQSVHYTV